MRLVNRCLDLLRENCNRNRNSYLQLYRHGCDGFKQYSVFTTLGNRSFEFYARNWRRHQTFTKNTSLTSSQNRHFLSLIWNTKRQIVTCGPYVPIPTFSCLTDYIFHAADRYPDEIALIDYATKSSLSFEQLQEEVQFISLALLSYGICRNDVITYFGTNRLELVQLLCAANWIGATISLANAQLTTDELRVQLGISGTKMLVATQECAQVAKVTASSCGINWPFIIGHGEGCKLFSSTKCRGEKLMVNRECPSENDVALIPFSSGTTGMPKGVQLSNRNLIAEIHGLRQPSYIPFKPARDVSICALPMVHIAGLVIGCLNALAQGATTVILSKFTPSSFLSAIQDYRGTFALIAPPIMTMLAKDPIVPQYDLSSLTTLYSGAAPLDKNLTEMVAERIGIYCIRQGYGMTETSPATHTSPLEGWKFGSVGIPLPNTRCKVVNVEDCKELGPNEEGELWVRGPQVMRGYHNNEDATRNAFSEDGWLKTGDVGYFDEDGHYFICDRIKDIIKYKGYQIPPAYLESVLLTHQNIQDVAVVGVRGGDGEEVPSAWVVVKDKGISLTVDDIQAYLNDRVAPFKRLRGGVRIVSAIPKSASGKILKRVIRDEQLNHP